MTEDRTWRGLYTTLAGPLTRPNMHERLAHLKSLTFAGAQIRMASEFCDTLSVAAQHTFLHELQGISHVQAAFDYALSNVDTLCLRFERDLGDADRLEVYRALMVLRHRYNVQYLLFQS